MIDKMPDLQNADLSLRPLQTWGFVCSGFLLGGRWSRNVPVHWCPSVLNSTVFLSVVNQDDRKLHNTLAF